MLIENEIMEKIAIFVKSKKKINIRKINYHEMVVCGETKFEIKNKNNQIGIIRRRSFAEGVNFKF